MRSIDRSAAQGDVFFLKVSKLPEGVVERTFSDGRAVVAHSETGHHHVAVAEKIRLFGTGDPMVNYLVAESAYADIVHERSFDTHETLRLSSGVWEVRRQREFSPEGERQVAD